MDAPHAGLEAEMLEAKEAKMRALFQARVFWRHESGVQFAARVVHAYSPALVNLRVDSDGYVDLGKGAGEPVTLTNVMLGPGTLQWQPELDR